MAGSAIPSSPSITRSVRQSIERGGERLWRLNDFTGLPFMAVAQALSRLARQGMLERLSKGVYYRGRDTALGKSRPNPAAIQRLAANKAALFPAGISAANLLGFTTQSARQGEISTIALSLPRKLVGSDAIIHTRRPEAWQILSQTDAAFLDFLRRRGVTSELSPRETVQRVLAIASESGRFNRLLKVAPYEPPRVRAMLGAIGQQLEKHPRALEKLRASLNPFSQFDFGRLSGLKHARTWQAKEFRSHETV